MDRLPAAGAALAAACVAVAGAILCGPDRPVVAASLDPTRDADATRREWETTSLAAWRETARGSRSAVRGRDAGAARDASHEPPGDLLDARAAPPGTERAHVAHLLALARRDAGAFRARVRELLGGTELPDRVAALRAWHEAGVAPAYEPFASVLGDPRAAPELTDFALRFLGRASRTDVDARRALGAFLHGSTAASRRHRAAALGSLLRAASDDELLDHRRLVHVETDPGVLAAGAQALNDNGSPLARTLLAELLSFHPDVAVRDGVAMSGKN